MADAKRLGGEWRAVRDRLKEQANATFTASNNKPDQLSLALEQYAEAIRCSVPAGGDTETAADRLARATLYANRAAVHLKTQSWNAAVSDCDAALKLNSQYTKALFRRATALEALAVQSVPQPLPLVFSSASTSTSAASGSQPPAAKDPTDAKRFPSMLQTYSTAHTLYCVVCV